MAVKRNILLQVIAMGTVAGMRAAMAPAVLSHYLGRNPSKRLQTAHLGFLQSPRASKVTKLLSTTELVVDKLPSTPARTVLPQVVARIASGAITGAALSINGRHSVVKGILVGGTAALAATYATYYLRKFIHTSTGLNDRVTAVLEDAAAVSLGNFAMTTL